MVGSDTILPQGGAKGRKSKNQAAAGGGRDWEGESPCWLRPLWHRRHPWLLAPPTASASSPLLCSTSSVTEKSKVGLKGCGQASEEPKGLSLRPRTGPPAGTPSLAATLAGVGKAHACSGVRPWERLSFRQEEDWPWGLLGPGEGTRQSCSRACPQQTPKKIHSAIPPRREPVISDRVRAGFKEETHLRKLRTEVPKCMFIGSLFSVFQPQETRPGSWARLSEGQGAPASGDSVLAQPGQ